MTLPLTPFQAHALIKAAEALNSEWVSGSGEYTQEEMDVAASLILALRDIAGDTVEPSPADLIKSRLEHHRAAIRAENISYGELADLQSLADHIEGGDVELAQWAGIDEEEFMKR